MDVNAVRAHHRAQVDPDVSLRTLRGALGPEGAQLDPDTRLRLIRDVFRVLDRSLCEGGGLPKDWRRWWLRRKSAGTPGPRHYPPRA